MPVQFLKLLPVVLNVTLYLYKINLVISAIWVLRLYKIESVFTSLGRCHSLPKFCYVIT